MIDERQESPPREDSAPPEGRSRSQLEHEFDRMIDLGEQTLALAKDGADLFRLEFVLALKSIPKAIAVWLLTLPALLLVWLSFSVMSAWAAYEWSGVPLIGFATLFSLQFLSLIFLHLALRKYQRRLRFPYTVESVQKFRQEVADATAKTD